mmetsp:Transcript_11937/g.14913  ORF Transcript_11937/g.14913 Transcript_11937/m.14913 type:complete len:83 (+) Transcript_11937:151-399(+)
MFLSNCWALPVGIYLRADLCCLLLMLILTSFMISSPGYFGSSFISSEGCILELQSLQLTEVKYRVDAHKLNGSQFCPLYPLS